MKSPFRAVSHAALLLAALFGLAQPAGATVNLLTNPGFEENGGSFDGWFTFGGGGLSTPDDDDIARTDSTAAKAFGAFAMCPGPGQFSASGFGQAFSPVDGMAYELSGWAFISSADPMIGTATCEVNRMVAKITFFDAPAGGAEIQSNEVLIGDGNFPVNTWYDFSVKAPAPANAQRVEALFLFLQPGCDEGAVFIDDTSFCEVPADPTFPNMLANPSFDMNLNGWSLFGNVFHDARAFTRRTAPGSAKMFSTFVADTPSGMFQSFPSSPENVWRLHAWAFDTCQEDPVTGGNANYVTARIVFRDGGGTEIGGNEVVLRDASSPLGTWTDDFVSAAAPEGTESVDAFILFVSPALEGGAIYVDDVSFWMVSTTDTPEGAPTAGGLRLAQNSPNPFNPTTQIRFELIEAGDAVLTVYDVVGRQVVTLVDGRLEAGAHAVTWDGRNASGARAASGTYTYVLETADGRTARRMTLLQ